MVPFRTAVHPYDPNCRMARVLARLYYLNPQEKSFRSSALAILEAYATVPDKGPGAALYALALAEYRGGPLWVWVIGNDTITGTAALRAAAYSVPVLWKLVVTLDPADPRDAETLHQMGFVLKRPPAVYFSSGTHTSTAAKLIPEVASAYKALADYLEEEKVKAAEKAREPQSEANPEGKAPSPSASGPGEEPRASKPH